MSMCQSERFVARLPQAVSCTTGPGRPGERRARRPVPPAPDRPVSLKGFGPQVVMRLHRAQRTAALAHKHESED